MGSLLYILIKVNLQSNKKFKNHFIPFFSNFIYNTSGYELSDILHEAFSSNSQ